MTPRLRKALEAWVNAADRRDHSAWALTHELVEAFREYQQNETATSYAEQEAKWQEQMDWSIWDAMSFGRDLSIISACTLVSVLSVISLVETRRFAKRKKSPFGRPE